MFFILILYIVHSIEDWRDKPLNTKNKRIQNEGSPKITINLNAATRRDKILTQIEATFLDIDIDKIIEILNKMSFSGYMIENLTLLTKQINPNAYEHEIHRTISLISHIKMIFFGILIHKTRRRSRKEQNQWVFSLDTGRCNDNFISGMIWKEVV